MRVNLSRLAALVPRQLLYVTQISAYRHHLFAAKILPLSSGSDKHRHKQQSSALATKQCSPNALVF